MRLNSTVRLRLVAASAPLGCARPAQQAMTLVELMVATGLFALVSVGLLFTHLFCLRQDELVNSKLGASDESRRGYDQLAEDVRSAKVWEVGTVNPATAAFTGIALGSTQTGNGLRMSYTTNWNEGVLYFFDTSNMAVHGGKLYRKKMATGSKSLIADYLTNVMTFSAEDYRGNAQTNRTHKGVIRAKMEFAQYQYPLTKVGPSTTTITTRWNSNSPPTFPTDHENQPIRTQSFES